MIRDITIEDINEINQLINDPHYKIDENELKRNAKVFIIDNKIVGFISYSIFYERAELNYIYVHTDFRQQKIASKLMEIMMQECLEKKVETIDLEVNVENMQAINLYKKYKFRSVNIRKEYYHGVDAYLMIKEMK